ncbi:MAG: DMT family transporter [Holophaga sp.]|nr:DMT family transporter [Holophaga sp.]
MPFHFVRSLRPRTRGLLLVATAAVLWSTSGLFIKALPLGPYPIALWRSLVAALTMLAIMKLRGQPTGIGFKPIDLACAGSYAGVLISFVVATKLTTAANAIFLQFSAPIYLLFLEPWVFRRPLQRRDLWAVAACLGGMALFFGGRMEPGGMLGNALGILSGLCLATFTLLLKWKREHEPGRNPAGAIVLGNVAVALICLPLALPMVRLSLGQVGALAFLGVFQLGLAYLIFSAGMRYVSATTAMIISMLEAVFNPIWVFLGVGERPSPSALVGAVVILGVILWYSLRSPAPEAPVAAG